MASDIRKCQAKGKIVTISLGGSIADVGFSTPAEAAGFAKTIWNMFLGMAQFSTRFMPLLKLYRRKYVRVYYSGSKQDLIFLIRGINPPVRKCHTRWVSSPRKFISIQVLTQPYVSFQLSVDLNIETGSPAYYTNFVNALRSLTDNSGKRYFVLTRADLFGFDFISQPAIT